jgi:hypothetical protein
MNTSLICVCGNPLSFHDRHHGGTPTCPASGNVVSDTATALQAEQPTQRGRDTALQADAPMIRAADGTLTDVDIRKHDAARGWLVALAAIVCGVMIVGVGGYFLTAPVGYTTTDLARSYAKGPLTQACDRYFDRFGRFPDNLAALTVHEEGRGPFVEGPDALIDPWGQPFQYDSLGPKNGGRRPDIWTVNPREGTIIGNWPKNR